MAQTSTRRSFDCELLEVAKRDFEPVQIPAIDWSDRQHSQRLWFLQVAVSMLGQSKKQLAETMQGMAEDGAEPLTKMSAGLHDAAEFFLAAHGACQAALARMVVVGAVNAAGSNRETALNRIGEKEANI